MLAIYEYVLPLVLETKFCTHTEVRVTLQCILIVAFLDSRQEDKKLLTKWEQVFSKFNLLLISLWLQFLFAVTIPKYLKFSTFPNSFVCIQNPVERLLSSLHPYA